MVKLYVKEGEKPYCAKCGKIMTSNTCKCGWIATIKYYDPSKLPCKYLGKY
ncbi:unnamed protein product, partial [marine sediment metagenome]